MKLTKKLEAEILKTYNQCWEAYLAGDLKTHASFLSKQFKIIGTSESEQFNSKKEWIAYCKKTIKQFAGVIRLRNRKFRLQPAGQEVMVTENSDIYALINNKWNFYSRIRISALLQKEKGGWKYIHQHGSLPDARANEGEVIATEQIKKENLQLREAVKRRTVELEQKNRELEIETALERVRAKAMAMHSSQELKGVVYELRKQMGLLGQKDLETCVIHLHDESEDFVQSWAGIKAPDTEGNILETIASVPKTGLLIIEEALKAYAANRKDYVIMNEGEKLKQWFSFLKNESPDGYTRLLASVDGNIEKLRSYWSFADFAGGSLLMVTRHKPDESSRELLRRFSNVFGLAYRRFADLKQAEAQARESQIQLALERIRARTMAMQKSDELSEVVFILFNQFNELGEKPDQTTIGIINEKEWVIEFWVTMYGNQMNKVFKFSIDEPHVTKRIYKAWKEEKKSLVIDLSGKELYEFTRYRERMGGAKHNPDEKRRIFNVAFFSKGLLIVQSKEVHSEESIHLLERFAAVFEQTYTRFLDLQKAEAQAREAQIEAALERVRARSMAMHKSEELKEVIKVVLEQFVHLNINVGHSGFYIDYKTHDDMHIWLADPNIEPFFAIIPYFDTPTWNSFLEAKAKARLSGGQGTTLHTDLLDFKEKNKFYKKLFKLFTIPQDAQKFYLQCKGLAVSTVLLDNVGLYIENFEAIPYTDEENAVLMRFGKVFQQTYTRFLDLQKAEAQAREAQIEAALEKVRSRSLAMHHSDELEQVAASLFDRLTELGLSFDGALIFIFEKERRNIRLWVATNQLSAPVKIELPYDEEIKNNAIIKDLWNAIENGKHIFNKSYSGETKNDYFRYVQKYNESIIPEAVKQIQLENESWTACFAAEKNSVVGFDSWSGHIMKEEDFQISIRFARVFEQAYTRFLDLQKAEAQAREAQIEAAMEKVRSRSLAMQKPGELTEVAELLRKEMGQLGVEELETSSIYIVDKENRRAECWYAIKDIREENKQLVSDEITITFADTWVGTEMQKFYRASQQQASIIMKGENRKEWINYCAGKSNVLQGYYGDEIPERTYHLVKFNGGYMGAASPGEISAESWDLLRRAAAVFSLAYTRFNDLQIAEAHARQAEQDLIAIKEAKQKAEEALTELQATQKQLIQSEKMASLGELTAGIAHEIQNPLNFVNNFSEVSKELLDEMKDELEKGNVDDAKEIMNDVIQNLEKINHHGKRADGIVKGMLQHSRSSTGQKELTDINALCDEYLRLAYHGLRAKDKSFNAKFETGFDETIGKINVIPQDIGRVILNLINNAFYAVTERKKAGEAGYEPTVVVSTKKQNGNVTISVRDNGTGIPQKVLDKIFQPFFTTKPTGQGTGLGLSLSYDITTKGHGGDLKVETKEGEFTQFTIILPYKP